VLALVWTTAELGIRAFPFSKTGSKVLSEGIGHNPKTLFSGHIIRNKNHEGAKKSYKKRVKWKERREIHYTAKPSVKTGNTSENGSKTVFLVSDRLQIS